MAKAKDYFGLGWLVSVILAIIPFTSWLCGFLTRLQEKHYLAAFLRLFLGWNIIWLLDLLLIVFQGKILRIL